MDAVLVVGGAILATWWVVRPRSPKRVSLPTVASGSPPSRVVGVFQIWMQSRVEHKRIRTIAETERLKIQYQHGLQVGARQVAAAQVIEHSQPQAHSNQIDNYIREVEHMDELRDRLLLALTSLYDGERIAKDGRIKIAVPWSKRGGWAQRDSERVVKMFNEAVRVNGSWVVRHDDERRAWFVNVKRYPTAGQAVRAFREVNTPP